jgi:hypothetical protein
LPFYEVKTICVFKNPLVESILYPFHSLLTAINSKSTGTENTCLHNSGKTHTSSGFQWDKVVGKK